MSFHPSISEPTMEPGEPGEPDWTASDLYPRLWNVSAAHLYRAVVRAESPEPPEYVKVPVSGRRSLDLTGAIASWNLLWEAAQFRRRFFDEDIPHPLNKVADRGDVNVIFVPRTRTRYHEYAPLFHLLPRASVLQHGLPMLRGGQWPFLVDVGPADGILPPDFATKLSRAWAGAVWRHLMPGSPMRGFTPSDPIRILAHNLDFWLPPVTEVIQEILRGLPEVDNGIVAQPPPLTDGTALHGAVMANPRIGSDLWRGEAEAAEVLPLVVEQADADGRLRGILDAVRSNRVEDDFSDHWSYAREDFERKLYRKRSKVKVRFVELTDTIPVQGPESEVVGQHVIGDFLALLDIKDRQIVVLLNSGVTKLGEVASILGYKNHSAVSKRLKKIRVDAERFLDER